MALQEQYIIGQIYENASRPKYIRSTRVYNFECPICNEGGSKGKKRRGYYIPYKNTICCHNCGWQSNPVKWIMQVTNKTVQEIFAENDEFYGEASDVIRLAEDTNSAPRPYDTLPEDSINLLSTSEVNFYKDEKAVVDALKYIKSRRLDTATYKPKALYVSTKDHVYKNSLCIPFYNRLGKIDFFQVRELEEGKMPKYRGKQNAEKTVFNLGSVDVDFPYLFLFEGPIDAMFVKNGVALAGIKVTSLQAEQLAEFPLHQKIWCLDNQYVDKTSRKLTEDLLFARERVFIWPKKYSKYKDVNLLCCTFGLDSISPNLFIKNSASSPLEAISLGYEYLKTPF